MEEKTKKVLMIVAIVIAAGFFVWLIKNQLKDWPRFIPEPEKEEV